MRKRVQDGIHSINGTGVGILGKRGKQHNLWVVAFTDKKRALYCIGKTCNHVSNLLVLMFIGGNDFIFVILMIMFLNVLSL